ncbi:MAG: site-specific DNA-methyltransferase, partial [Phycisphaerae bacterium]|nr:site-specific DNA-methyltransferase [Phycisphaerae bacterium]
HIYLFLSRYYDHGDYISKRRYSQTEKYAIPHNGEEVMLYWANNDQYYIKTGEHFKSYAFKKGEYTIDFRILDAESTMNNNKSDKRYFVLKPSEQNPKYDPRSKTLTIFFEYRGLSKDEEKKYGTRNVQDNINEKTVEAVLSSMQNPGLKAALNGGTDDKAALGRHLKKYTKRNTSDYFIHKNLKGFLTRELDFYIKNEVFHLDDLGTENEVSIERYVTRAKVIKAVCLKIIDFLAQIEDFQKELFKKKKFVMRTDYCMTLDNVPEKLYPEILRNDEQLSEWKTLYGTNGSVGEAYLKKHPSLVLDTKFFDKEFKDELLASFDDLDDAVGGLMIKSENWQALNLTQETYHEKVKCIYIDPPYNTEGDRQTGKFLYNPSSPD